MKNKNNELKSILIYTLFSTFFFAIASFDLGMWLYLDNNYFNIMLDLVIFISSLGVILSTIIKVFK